MDPERSTAGCVADAGACQTVFVLFDTHCHFDFDEFGSDRAAFLRRAREQGVTKLLIPGVSPQLWQRQARVIAESSSYGAVGIHPFWAHEVTATDLEAAFERLESALADRAIVAVGECGLDRLHAKRGAAPLEWQVKLLERQLEIAQRRALPVIVHCVRAHGRLIESLDAVGPLPKGGVLHAYSGSPELVSRYAERGMYFGFGGAITRPAAVRVRRALLEVPHDRLVLETDAPDQTPSWSEPPNQPAELRRIAEAIADLRGVTLEALAQQTTENAARLFGVPADEAAA